MLRQMAIRASKNAQLRRLALSTPGFRDVAWRLVAGENLDAAVVVVRELLDDGIDSTVNVLGMHTAGEAEARLVADRCVETVTRLAAEGLRAHLSLKLTAIGLDIDESFCRAQLLRVLQAAAECGVFVRIDMEESPYVEATVRLHGEMAERFGDDAVGIVIQSYLRRPPYDLRELVRRGARIRLVKGGYREPPAVVLSRADADSAFRRDIELLLREGTHPAIATHDVAAVNHALRVAADARRPADTFEFQMLYGVKPALARRLAASGYRVRAYVPFGGYWLNWLLLSAHALANHSVSRTRRVVRGRRRQPAA